MRKTFVFWTMLGTLFLLSLPLMAKESNMVPELVPPEQLTETGAKSEAVEAPAEAVEPAPVEEAVAAPEPVEEPAPVEELAPIEGMEGLEELEQLEEDEGFLAEEEQISFFELHGYFRLRADMFHNLDIGVFNDLRPLGDAGTTTAEQDAWKDIDRTDSTIGTANIRLKLKPTLNISEDIKIHMEFDILDNVVLGSTPDTYLRGGPGGLASGIAGFSTSQVPPSSGANAAVDSIMVRRVWAEVRTPVGEIRFGRMPSHWGMGIMVNSGNEIDSDYGDTVDRIMFATKLFDHVLFTGMDFVNDGITNETNFEYMGQPKDATQLDDVQQIIFGFARKHNAAEALELLENDEFVLDYGFYNVIRWQSYSLENTTIGSDSVPLGTTPAADFSQRQRLRALLMERDLFLYIGDLWAKFLWKGLHVELEAIWITGNLGDAAKDSGEQQANEALGITDNSLAIDQYAICLQVDYKLLEDDALFLGVEWGLASGDPYSGFGVYPYQNRQYSDNKYQSLKYGSMIDDRAVTNFRFDPDYNVDLILFEEIIGTVTDATYLKPTIAYDIYPNVGLKLDLILSWAMEANSTPSYEHMKFESMADVKNGLPVQRLTSRFLGTELDFEVWYKSFDGFGASLQYGVFFPGAALGYWDPDYLNENGDNIPSWFDAPNIAQTVQLRMWVEF